MTNILVKENQTEKILEENLKYLTEEFNRLFEAKDFEKTRSLNTMICEIRRQLGKETNLVEYARAFMNMNNAFAEGAKLYARMTELFDEKIYLPTKEAADDLRAKGLMPKRNN